MDFLHGNIKNVYFKYLSAAFGSALVSSIYGAVDMAMVGQYQGPDGTAALAVVAPIWNVIYSLGLLMGIGGSVLFSTLRGQSKDNIKESNEVFTNSLLGSMVLGALAWILICVWNQPILALLGANSHLMPLAQAYLFPIQCVFPIFLFNQFLAAYLRNDKDPALATKAVLLGGVFNMIGDYVFVFGLDMGMAGAGLATALGALLSFVLMLLHFFSERNTLRLVQPTKMMQTFGKIVVTGFSTFFIDIAMGIVTICFNTQIMRYLGTDALAIYGIIINISTFVQACAYSIGQAAQPILSVNFGAGQGNRIVEVLKYAFLTAIVFGAIWTLLIVFFPQMFVYIFMSPTSTILELSPTIIRTYGISFLILPINIVSTYYFQSILKPRASFIVSVTRGAILSGALILFLPRIVPQAIWWAMPITELVVAVYAMERVHKYTKEMV